MQKQSGHKDFEEMSSKEKFAYLDQQKKAFDKYYKEQWALTKKAILKSAFAEEAERSKKKKGKKGKKAEEPEPTIEEAPVIPETPIEQPVETPEIEEAPVSEVEEKEGEE